MSARGKIRLLLSVAAVAVGMGAATYAQHDASDQPQAAAPPATPVDTVKVEKHPVRLWHSFSARLEAVDEVSLRPQVSGRIVDIRFRDGQPVRKGEVLFVIDPRPFDAAVAQAKADLAGARERRTFAGRELERARKLIRTNAVPERIVDQRENETANARAQVLAAAARLQEAEIDLDHAYVKAPIGGRVSRAEVTVGNLVQAGANSPVLTTIVSDNGIYADFDVDETTYLRHVRSAGPGAASERAIPVKLTVGGEELSGGRIHAFDNRIDPKTGTIRARAHFANADGRLLPGMFATVSMGSASESEAVLLTERAILTDQDRKFVYVVDAASKAAYREVRLGAAVSGQRVILDGLKAGEEVIVGGMMVVRPNAPVAPKNDVGKAGGESPARLAAEG
ncbi:MAG: efflux RND transporter periplasmic adaptor subunit [Alphaproteobacteria bacterium]|nr:efflux RND transporter periplasmic adaptor subunit [Alphaproteobacteria bacterium]